MKIVLIQSFCLAAILSFVSCSDNGKVKERPDDIVQTGARAEVYQQIMAEFPESRSVKDSKPDLFANSTTKQILLKTESDVYVTFISEGASFPNTFGWYSYDANS